MGTGGIVYPADFGLALDRTTRRPAPRTLIGGSPLRVVRLSDRGSQLLDRWLSGGSVGALPGAQRLARRLVEAGIAHPRPPECGERDEDVTVVVPVRDRPDGLAATLAGLNGLDVLVVDDASVEPVSLQSHQVIRRPRPGGPSAARNAGWRSTAAPVVVFLDADCVPEPHWLARLLPHFGDPRVGAVAPRVRSAPGPGLLARFEEVRSPLDMGPDPASVRPATTVPYVPTACLAVRLCALEETGGFDESLLFGEDVDLVWRLARAGWVVRYEPRAVVSHPPRGDLRSMARQRFDYGRSAASLAERHGSQVAPLQVSPWSASVWSLVALGRPVPAAAIAATMSVLVSRRVPSDPAAGRTLALLAAKGNLSAGRWIATAVRRAWTPPLLLVMCCTPRRARRRVATWLAVSFAWPAAEWVALSWKAERPVTGPLSWTALSWADDLSYQCGLWFGALERRSIRALLPRWNRRLSSPPGGQEAATASSSARPVSR